MREELISMTSKELTRLEIIQKVKDKRLKQHQAVEYLNLSLVQVKRLCKQYKKEALKVIIDYRKNLNRKPSI